VLVDSTEACYLADFGLAWSLGTSRVTNSGEMVGTACYLAPEQVTGAVVDRKTDVYALGLVLLECLTGRTEYGGTEVEAAVARLSRQPVVSEQLGTSWRHLLTAMTAYDPADRPDAAQAAHQLSVLTQPQSSTQDMPRRNAAPNVNDTGKRTTAMPLAHRVSHEQTTSRLWARPRRTTKVHTALGVVGAAAVALIVATTGTTGTAGQPTPDSAPRGLDRHTGAARGDPAAHPRRHRPTSGLADSETYPEHHRPYPEHRLRPPNKGQGQVQGRATGKGGQAGIQAAQGAVRRREGPARKEQVTSRPHHA
jgi:hypothetical protein